MLHLVLPKVGLLIWFTSPVLFAIYVAVYMFFYVKIKSIGVPWNVNKVHAMLNVDKWF